MEYSSSINHKSNGPIGVEVNVKSIIDLLFLAFSLVITPGLLLRIKLKFLIIYSNGPASVFFFEIREF